MKNKGKFGKWLKKVSSYFPEVAGIGMEVLTGDVTGAISQVRDILKNKQDSKANEFLIELEADKQEFEQEVKAYELEVEDRKSARLREVNIRALGDIDFMQYITGLTGLCSFAFIIYALAYIKIPIDNKDLFIHLVGIIEGVVLSIVSYYFGSKLKKNL